MCEHTDTHTHTHAAVYYTGTYNVYYENVHVGEDNKQPTSVKLKYVTGTELWDIGKIALCYRAVFFVKKSQLIN